MNFFSQFIKTWQIYSLFFLFFIREIDEKVLYFLNTFIFLYSLKLDLKFPFVELNEIFK